MNFRKQTAAIQRRTEEVELSSSGKLTAFTIYYLKAQKQPTSIVIW